MAVESTATEALETSTSTPEHKRPLNTNGGTETNIDGSKEEITAVGLKVEEIVLILPAPDETKGKYLIYSLAEKIPPDDTDGKAFSLAVSQSQLPDDSPLLGEFLLEPYSLPPPHLKRRPDDAGSKTDAALHVVVSTRSGLQLAQEFYGDVLRPLLSALELGEDEEDGYQVTVTKDSNSIRDFARELGNAPGERTIILLSGDGGVVDILNGLDQAPESTAPVPPPTIALLPLGTGNALFHSLHKPHYSRPDSGPVPSPLVLGLRTLLKGTPASLPTFRASFSPGSKLVAAPAEPGDGTDAIDSSHAKSDSDANDDDEDDKQHTYVTHLVGAIVASYGFHASLVWESDTLAYRKHGAKRFGMAAAELLKTGHAYDATVEVRRRGAGAESGTGTGKEEFVPLNNTGEEKEKKFNYVLATLVSNLEKTFTISPAGKPLDGRLRLVHFGDVGGDKTMEIMMAAYREGEHVGMPEVGYEEVEEVRVTVHERDPRWRKVCVDGSIVEVGKGGWMSVRREEGGRVRVLVDGCVGEGVVGE